MLHTSPLAAAAGNETFEKEDEEEEHKEEEKRTCEMWQLKLSSGGGTYGIHFCVVFDDDWSFKPKNIAVVVVVVVFLVVRGKTTRMQFLQKKRLTRRSILPPQMHLASDDLTEWAPLTSVVSSSVQIRPSLWISSAPKQNFSKKTFFQLEKKRHQSVL